VIVTTGIATAVVLATVAAVLFALAAVAQNDGVAAVRRPDARGVMSRAEWRALARSRIWLSGVVVNGLAATLHAGALVLAPVALVQPIGVLSVPFAIVLAARRTGVRPPAQVRLAVAVCLIAVAGFVVLADHELGTSATPRFAGVAAAALGAGAGAALLALAGLCLTGWRRCVAFAAAGATAFGLVSALMRLVALHLASGAYDLDDVGVWLPACGIVLALVGGGWAVQQAHAAGAPAVVVGCLTVVDPLVAVVLGTTMLGEGAGASTAGVLGLVGLAALAVSAALVLAGRHPAAQPAVSRRPAAWPPSDRPAG
jgi:hypothetical protein